MIAIRFLGPPGHEAGRFVEVERDGVSIEFGEWKRDGEYWLLELTDVQRLVENMRTIHKITLDWQNSDQPVSTVGLISLIQGCAETALVPFEEKA